LSNIFKFPSWGFIDWNFLHVAFPVGTTFFGPGSKFGPYFLKS